MFTSVLGLFCGIIFRRQESRYYSRSFFEVFFQDFIRPSVSGMSINTRIRAFRHYSQKCSMHCSTLEFWFTVYFSRYCGVFPTHRQWYSSRRLPDSPSSIIRSMVTCSLHPVFPTHWRDIDLRITAGSRRWHLPDFPDISSSRLTDGIPTFSTHRQNIVISDSLTGCRLIASYRHIVFPTHCRDIDLRITAGSRRCHLPDFLVMYYPPDFRTGYRQFRLTVGMLPCDPLMNIPWELLSVFRQNASETIHRRFCQFYVVATCIHLYSICFVVVSRYPACGVCSLLPVCREASLCLHDVFTVVFESDAVEV